MTSPIDEVILTSRSKMGDRQRIIELRKALSSCIGYLTNAAIDLETGAPKRTALMTINGGIKMAREALAREDMQEATSPTTSLTDTGE